MIDVILFINTERQEGRSGCDSVLVVLSSEPIVKGISLHPLRRGVGRG
jgi:hypothetical protein